MATTTTNLSLRKPESTDIVNVALDIANSMQTIDDKWASSAAADIGAAAAAGTALTVARTDHVHKVASGSVTNPGLPVGESNTGLYRIATGELGVTIAGTLIATIKAIGLVIETAFTGKHISTPAAPAAGYTKLYTKSDANWYKQTAAGDEVLMLDTNIFTAAGQIPYATGDESVGVVTAGTSTQILHGGTTPSFGQVVAADIAPGTATLLKIAEVSGTGSSGVIEFSSIPDTYRVLLLYVVGRSDAVATSAAVRLTFETSPTAGAYDYQFSQSNNTTVAGVENYGAVDYILAGTVSAASSTSNLYAHVRIDMPEYANTGMFKQVKCSNAGVANLASSGGVDTSASGVWESTAAIGRVRLTLSAGNWTATSRATLYGLPA